MTQFIYLFNILVLVLSIQISKAQDNNFVPPILVTCAAVPEDTGGTWDCHPPNIMGYPVLTGTICYFICNGTSLGANICSNLGKWDKDPEKRTCENGSPTSTTLSSTTKGSTVIPTTTISPHTTTVRQSTTTTLAPSTTPIQQSTSPTQPTTTPTEPPPTTTTTAPSTTPILVACAAVPEDTGGTWDCHPPNIMGYPVHTGTICYFICNGTSVGANICGNLGMWDTDPEQRTCEDGAPTSTTLSSTTQGSTPTQPTTNPTEPSTTPAQPTTSISTEPSTTHPDYENCPFSTKTNWKQDRSLYCPQSYCPAVFIESTGSALENQPDSIGCFNYEGSLMADEYPIYINSYGRFLTPHAYSNPVIGYTVWLVSDVPMDTNGTIRNNKHDDMFCPYDMHDGWEYRDAKTGQWVEDTTMTVNCVKA